MLRIILLAFVLCLSSSVFLQENKLKKLEMEIVGLLKDRTDFDKMYINREKAKDKLLDLVKLDSNFQFPMDSLKEYSSIKISEDKKVRIVSFDLITGGTWHDYACIAQFKGGYLDLNAVHCMKEGCFTDAAVFQIETIELNKKKYYLTYAYGTHGAGHHHRIARVYHFVEGKLKLHSSFMNGEDLFIMESARRYRPKFEYDSTAKTLNYPEFKPGTDSGFLEPTGKILKYKLSSKGFRLQ